MTTGNGAGRRFGAAGGPDTLVIAGGLAMIKKLIVPGGFARSLVNSQMSWNNEGGPVHWGRTGAEFMGIT